MFGFGKFK